MIIDNTSYSGSLHNYGTYKGRAAFKSYNHNTIYVFTGISARRVADRDQDFSRYRSWKLVFVTNKQLLAMDMFEDIKGCVFDGKHGTRYDSRSSCGSYFWCKGGQPGIPEDEQPKPRKPYKARR